MPLRRPPPGRPATALRALPSLLLLLLAACGGEKPAPAPPAAEAPAEAPGEPRLSIEAWAGTGSDRHALGGLEVRLVPEEEMAPHLARKRAETGARLAELHGEEARLDAEFARLRAENDQANQAWMKGAGDYLRERTALNMDPGRSAADIMAERRAITRTRKAIREQALAAARSALGAERRLGEVRREAERLRTGALLDGLVAGRVLYTGPSGGLEVSLPAGRWAVVALPPAAGGHPASPWLAWVDVGAEPARLVLDDSNRLSGSP